MEGATWRLRGPMWGVTLSAHHLWRGVRNDIEVAFGFMPADLVFPTGGNSRHASGWITTDQLEMIFRWRLPEGVGDDLTEEDLEEFGLTEKEMAVRAIITPFKSKNARNKMEAKVLLAVTPRAPEALVAKGQAWNVNPNSYDGLPVIVAKDDHTSHRGKKIPLGITEQQGWDLGMGIVPMIECRTNEENFNYPTRNEVAAEFQAFMKEWPQVNVHKLELSPATGLLESLEEIYEKENNTPGNFQFYPEQDWPIIYKDPAEGKGKYKVACRYGEKGSYSERKMKELGVTSKAAALAAQLANNSRASKTWRMDDTVRAAIERAKSEWGINLTFPWDEAKLINFITHLASKGLNHSTVRQYVSIAKNLHKQERRDTEAFSSHIAASMQQGIENSSAPKPNARGVVTPEIMWTLKKNLEKSGMSLYNKKITWFIMCAMFNAALRASEILAEGVDKVTNKKNLKWKDVSLKRTNVDGKETKIIVLNLQAPKEVKGCKDIKVDIYQNDSFTDLISAYEDLRKITTLKPENYVASWTSGKLITQNYMNKLLRKLLNNNSKWEGPAITTHSFRAALPTIMGALGFSEDAIKRFGRWSSSAYLAYLKKGKNQRKFERFAISSQLARTIGRAAK